MKIVSDIIKILFSTIILFIILNFLISLFWPYYLKIKFTDFKPYSAEIIEQLGMSQEDAFQLYKETWLDGKSSYSQFLEHVESPFKGKFVNVSKEYGRKVNNPEVCNRRIFIYGGSTTFGYNVADFQTIPEYLQKELINNGYEKYCVYNFGSGGYFSTQENIRFQKHLLSEKILENDFVIFIDGHNESGNRKSRATDLLTEMFKHANSESWEMYKYTLPTFIKSLPVIQFSNRILKKINIDLDENVSQAANINYTPDNLLYVFQKNLDIRSSLCKIENLNCYSFLQPFASVHGVFFTTRDGVELKKGDAIGGSPQIGKFQQLNPKLYEKYHILKNAKGMIDISSSLNTSTELSWCDVAHYCPKANEMIAKRIYLEIKDNLN